MKKIALLALVLVGCLDLQNDETPANCYGLRRTEQACVYQGVSGHECSDKLWVRYDFERLADSEVEIRCAATDEDATITIFKSGVDCGEHFVEACGE